MKKFGTYTYQRATVESGFTLVETLITIVVVAVALMACLLASTAIQQITRSAHERTVALQDANRVAEDMRDAAILGLDNVTATYPGGGAVGGFENLTGETITVAFADTAADPLDTTITVAWTDNVGRDTNASLRTYITQRS